MMENIYKTWPATKVGVIFASPHSGKDYPSDFGYDCSLSTLQSVEDTSVDDLFEDSAVAHGAGFIKALFPRSYVDVNRDANDMDAVAFEHPAPDSFNPSNKGLAGHGVFHTYIKGEIPIYTRRLTLTEAKQRLELYYAPYHQALGHIIKSTHEKYGNVLLVDCHAMSPSALQKHFSKSQQPDFILGDLDGTSCDIAIRKKAQKTLTNMGYQIAINTPFKGATILKRHTDPAHGIHGLQIEINKKLYLDVNGTIIDKKFNILKDNLNKLVAKICA